MNKEKTKTRLNKRREKNLQPVPAETASFIFDNRIKLGLSLEELAEKSKVSRSTLWRIEKRHEFDLNSIKHIKVVKRLKEFLEKELLKNK